MKKLIIFSSLIIVFVFFYGCDKDKVFNHKEDAGNHSNVVYSSNPYDWIGVEHNKIIDSLINNMDLTKLPRSCGELENNNLFNNYISETIYKYIVRMNIFNYELVKNDLKECTVNLNCSLDTLYNKSLNTLKNINISTLDSFYTSKILQFGHNVILNNDSTYIIDSLLNNINSLENEILLNVTSEDTIALLSIAILKKFSIKRI